MYINIKKAVFLIDSFVTELFDNIDPESSDENNYVFCATILGNCLATILDTFMSSKNHEMKAKLVQSFSNATLTLLERKKLSREKFTDEKD